MKKRNIILIGMLVILIGIVIMFTKEEEQMVSLDDTIIDVTQFTEYKGTPIIWVSTGQNYLPINYGEKSIVRAGWSIDGSSASQPSVFQFSLLYKNKIQSALSYYFFTPNRVYDWPNFYKSNGNYSKEAEAELNANRYGFYCGIGSKNDCQIWNYWAQYDNYLVLMGLYDVGGGVSMEEFELYVSELDSHITKVIGQ